MFRSQLTIHRGYEPEHYNQVKCAVIDFFTLIVVPFLKLKKETKGKILDFRITQS